MIDAAAAARINPARATITIPLPDDLASLIEHLDLRELTLVGHSMAGGEVARYLTRHGCARIARIVLVAPTTPCLRLGEDNPVGVPREIFDAMIDALSADRPAFMAASSPGFFGEHGSAQMIAWVVSFALRSSPLAAMAMVRAFSTTDFRGDMASFKRPTLIIHGDADQSSPLDLTGRRTAAAATGSRLKVYAGAPHGLFITHRAQFNADLLEFVGAGEGMPELNSRPGNSPAV